MEGFGIDKILLILVVVLLLFGAKRIPEIAGSFGKGIREFKRQMNSVEEPEALPPARPQARPEPSSAAEPAEPKRLR